MQDPPMQDMPTAPSLPLDDHICFALYAATHAMTRVYQPLLQTVGLTYPQYIVMVALWERDGRSIGDLGRALGLESNTLTPLLKRLETAGYVDRHRSREDERRVIVTLTGDGRAMRDATAVIPACIFEACGMTPEEMSDLVARLRGLRARLEGRR